MLLHVKLGGTAELTVIEKRQVLILLALSVAVQDANVVPLGKIEPDVMLQLCDLIPEPSEAVKVKFTKAPLRDVGTTFRLPGHATDGGDAS